MKKIILTSLIIAIGTSFADPIPPMQGQVPTAQPTAQPIGSMQQPQIPMPSSQPSSPSPSTEQPSASAMPPIEIKPEDKSIINLKKKMVIKQAYNDYQKIDKATSIDKVNLEKSLREAKYSLKVQVYKEKQLDAQLSHPYYYAIPVKGVVGNVALTDQTPLKDGTRLNGNDRIAIKDGLVYIGDYLVSYPVMDNIKQPKIEDDSASGSPPQLLTGMPPSNEGSAPQNSSQSPSGSPPMPLPPPVPTSSQSK